MKRSMTLAIAFAIALLILTPATLSAQEVPDVPGAAPADTAAVRLADLIEEAARRNPSLRAARQAALAQHAQSAQVSSLPDPTAGLAYQPYPILTARGYQRSQWRLQQEIPFPGKLRLRGEIATFEAEATEAEADVYAQNLILQITQAYDELYRIQEQTRLTRQFQQELRGFEEAASMRYATGEGTQQAILKAQLERGALQIRLEQLAEEEQTAFETLARLLDRPDLSSLGTVAARTPALVLGKGDLLTVALDQRPEVGVVRSEMERADRRVALARRQFLPDFTFSANYYDIGAGGGMPTSTGRDAVAFNVGVKIPLWPGRLKGGLEEARAEERQAEAQLDALETSFQTELTELTERRARQERQLELLGESLIPQAETTLEATLSAYTTGSADFLDLLDAERTLYNLRLQHIDTRARYLKTSAALERALGYPALGTPTR